MIAYSSMYARAVKQKVWNEAENKERDWTCEARALLSRENLTPRFTDFFTDLLCLHFFFPTSHIPH